MKSVILGLAVSVLGLTGIVPDALAQQPQPEPVREIKNIRGDLYRVQDGEHFTVFLVTLEGIILGDPLNRAASRWLKAELETRFPNRPVRFVLYTHHAFDRASGAATFNDTAEIVGHENFNSETTKASSVLPPSLAEVDQDKSGALEATEIAGSPRRTSLAALDRDGDGLVTVGELYLDVFPVESTYHSRRTIRLGGKRVELVHPGSAYAADMTVLHFPEEGVVFGAGYPPLMHALFSFGSSGGIAVLASLRVVEALFFDTFVSGNGDLGSKGDVTALRRYVEELVQGVSTGFKAQLTLDQIQSSLTLDKYQGTPNYAQWSANIADVYRRLRSVTTSVYGVAQINHLQRGEFCTETYFECTDTGGAGPMGTAGVTVAASRVAVTAEGTLGGRFTGRKRTAWVYEDTVEHRDSVFSVLASYKLVRDRSMTVGISGGLSRVSEDERQTAVVRDPAGRQAARYSSSTSNSTGWGRTLGMDIVTPIGNGVSVLLPVRLTHTTMRFGTMGPGIPGPVGHWNVYAGVGLILPIFTHVH